MDWEERLVSLYVMISNAYDEQIRASSQRLSNGGYKRFSDEEVMTIYLWSNCIGLTSIKQGYEYTKCHLGAYFPQLPGYAAFAHRVKQLGPALNAFVIWLQSKHSPPEDERIWLVDSFPIVLAKNQHAYRAKVGAGFASKSYNATKKMHYYRVKAHVVARKNTQALPDIEYLIVDTASRQDGPIFDELLRPQLQNNLVFADQAYRRPDAQAIEEIQELKVITPIQKSRGQKSLPPEQKAFSQAVSRIRQPIEALFGWIQRKTHIQDASRVRSLKGLVSHIFAKLAAALILKNCPAFDF